MAKIVPNATRNALLFCTILAWQSVCIADEYDVYLLAGQSNMDGRGSVSDLPEYQKKPVDNAIIFYRNESRSSDGWQPLAPGFSVPPKYKGGFPSPTFGPEIGFAHSMLKSQPKRQLALIKGSKGGTSLRADWKPGVKDNEDSQGPQYRDFIQTIRLATKQLRERGDQFMIRGLLWHQGESDSKSSTEIYSRRLKELIARIREDVAVPDLPIVVGEVFDNGKRDSVRAAIQAVAAESQTVGLVTSDGTSTSDPGTHFDAKSQLLLGERYASAISRLHVLKRERAAETDVPEELSPTECDVADGDDTTSTKVINIKSFGAIGDGVAMETKAGPIMITGIPGHLVENVTLENVKISFPGHGSTADAKRELPQDVDRYPEQFFFGVLPSWGAYIRHAKNIEFFNVELETRAQDARKKIYLEDVEGFVQR